MWLPEDLAEQLAWQAEQRAKCDGCGQPKDESMNPDNDGAYEVTALRCHSCAAMSAKSKTYSDMSSAGLYLSPHLSR